MATRFRKKKLAPDDQRFLTALGHPVRAEALGILNTRVASPAEISRTLGLDVSNVAYHVRRLLEYECIELVETRAARGATEHFYRGVAHKYLDESFWTKLSGSVRNAVSLTALRVAFGAIREAIVAGTFDSRANRHLSVVTYDLDGQGWDEICELYLQTLDRTMEIAVESSNRLSEGKPRGQCLRASFVQAAFESPPHSPRSDPPG
jgi:DNA-binding transcriptional ArsR family regulator